MALVEGCAIHRVIAHATPLLAGVGLRAVVFVATGHTVCLRRVRADPGARVTGTSNVALIQGGASDWIGPCATPLLACVSLSTQVAVVTAGAIGLGRIATGPCIRVAGARHVTLVQGRADHGVCPSALASLAGVGLGTQVAVVAGRAIGLGGVGADTGTRIAGPGHVALVQGHTENRVGP